MVSGSPSGRRCRAPSNPLGESDFTFRISHDSSETGGFRHFSCGSQYLLIIVKSLDATSAFAQPPVGSLSNCGTQFRPRFQRASKTGRTLVFDESYLPPGMLFTPERVASVKSSLIESLARLFANFHYSRL